MALQAFISSLIKNVPNKNIPKEMDLILDGGAFNGIYMLGGLFYIKELEQRNKVKIKRISGCSIGAVLGLLFILNRMDISIDISTYAFKCLRKHQHLKQLIDVFKNKFFEIIRDDDMLNINNKFYLTYFDTVKGKQIIKKTYNSKEELLNCLIKSLYVPYLIDKNLTDKEGCIDGAFPYIFKPKKDRKILFLNLQSLDKIKKMIFIKHEKNIYPRLLEGLMDTHFFFESNKSNNMCSYVNNWSIIDILIFRLREILYVTLVYIFRLGLKVDTLFPESWRKDPFIKQHISVFKNIWRDIILYLTI
jgi:hypothetical protein